MCPKLEKTPGCIQQALSILGDKWTGLILRDLFDGPKRFSQLEKSLSGISPRTLSQRLDMLEAEVIVKKTISGEPTLHTEYSLTQKGQDCSEILKQMAAWGAKYGS
jgi:DNA-binding HxlR family transcriptional regulator